MHELDEILLLYAGQDVLTRKYLLSILPSIPTGHDGGPLIDHLWSEATSPEPRIAHQARIALGRALPTLLRTSYGLAPGLRGVWSLVSQTAAQKELLRHQAALDTSTDAELASLAHAALERLEPCARRLVPLAVSPSPALGTVASMILGRIATEPVVELLSAQVSRQPGSFELSAALAEMPDQRARSMLTQEVARSAAQCPDELMLMAAGADDHRAALLAAASARTDAYGRSNIAQALQGASTARAFALLSALIRRNEGWVSAYALDAATAWPPEQARALVQRVWDREDLEFLEVRAVQSAGFIASGWAVEFLLERLQEPRARVQAAALEGLARRQVDPAVVVPAARRLLTSPLLKARVNAILTLAPIDREPASEAIHTLLYSSRAMHRLEAAYVLGYVRGVPSIRALERMAAEDPSPAVQIQAVKSLARQPVEPALEALERLLASAHSHVATAAATAAAGLADESPGVAQTLERGLAGPLAGPARAAALRSLGLVAARTSAAHVPGALVAGLSSDDPTTLVWALEAVKVLGDALPRDAVRPLLCSGNPRIATRAALALVLSGDLDALGDLDRRISGPDMEEVQCALWALLELSIVAPASLRCARFASLARALGSRLTGACPAQSGAVPVESLSNATTASAPVGGGGGGGTGALGAVVTVESVAAPVATRALAPWRSIPAVAVDAEASRKLGTMYTSEKEVRRTRQTRVDAAQVSAASYFAGLLATRRGVWDQWRAYAPLAAIPLVLLVPAALTISRYQAFSPASVAVAEQIPASAFRVTFVQGPVTRRRAGRATNLMMGDGFMPGDTLSSGPRAGVALSDGDGAMIWLGADSGLAAVAGSGPRTLGDPAGEVALDFTQVDGGELALGAAHAGLSRAAVKVTASRQRATLEATRGVVIVHDASGQRELLPHQTMVIEILPPAQRLPRAGHQG